jgi:hypothetical protein
MKHSSVQNLQTCRLIANIRRVVDVLNADIAHEESQTGISDPRLPEYSMVARALIARRENLECTLASLEVRLTHSDPSTNGRSTL